MRSMRVDPGAHPGVDHAGVEVVGAVDVLVRAGQQPQPLGGVAGNRLCTQACWARIAATSSESASGSRRPIRAALWLS